MTTLDWALLAVHGLIVYSWLVFPAMVALLSRRLTANTAQPPLQAPPKRLSIILSAFNEETTIGERIRNLLETDYPQTHWRAYVGIDGASDGTAAKAFEAAGGHEAIHIFNFEQNRGKVAVLKDLVARAQAAQPAPDILVFTDANTNFAPDSLHHLCAPFEDASIGGVCGKLSFVKGAGTQTEENVYWRLENWLKAREGMLASCLGANGAIYAIRSPLFWHAIPTNTIVDDFVIGMKVRERNYRFVYEGRAIAWEELPQQVKDEWKRRVRIGAGNFQALKLCAQCLKPSYGMFAWIFWSHKVMRWFTPHLMLAGAVLSLAALAFGIPSLLAIPFAVLYAGIAAFMMLGPLFQSGSGRLTRLFRGFHYLLVMQAAIFAGFLRFCRGNLEGRWQRTAR